MYVASCVYLKIRGHVVVFLFLVSVTLDFVYIEDMK